MAASRRMKRRRRNGNRGQKRRDAVLIGLVREVRDLRRQMDRQQPQPARPQIIDVGGQYPARMGAANVPATRDNTMLLLAGLAVAVVVLGGVVILTRTPA